MSIKLLAWLRLCYIASRSDLCQATLLSCDTLSMLRPRQSRQAQAAVVGPCYTCTPILLLTASHV